MNARLKVNIAAAAALAGAVFLVAAPDISHHDWVATGFSRCYNVASTGGDQYLWLTEPLSAATEPDWAVNELGIHIRTLREGIDTTSAHGQLLAGLFSQRVLTADADGTLAGAR